MKRGNDRHAAGLRLQQRDRGALGIAIGGGDAGEHEQIALIHALPDIAAVLGAGKRDLVRERPVREPIS